MSPNTYSLVSVSARPSKRVIDVTFAHAHGRVLKQYPFFPSLYLPRTSTTVFETLLGAQAFPRHQVLMHEKSVQILAGTWEDLKAIAHRLHTQTGYFPALVEPERQFLLTQNWKYFQTFDAKFSPTSRAFEDALVPGLAESLYATLNGLAHHAPQTEKALLLRMIASHELSIPFSDVPITLSEQLETRLTNECFSSQVPAPLARGKPVNMENWSMEQRALAHSLALQTPMEGEGNCSCCAPASMFHSNVHAGSLIESTATQDGVYIHTNHGRMSAAYHEAHDQKEKREARAREWGLLTIPIGPLHRGEKIVLPLQDILEGQRNGLLKTEQPPKNAAWHCLKKKTTLETIQATLKERARVHATLHQEIVQPYLNKYQLAYTLHAEKNPVLRLHHVGQKMLGDWEKGLAPHLLHGETLWRGAGYRDLIQGAVGE